MNTQQSLMEAIQNSPVFAEVTALFNRRVEECNRTGVKITAEERSKMKELRVLMVIAADDNVRKLYADDLWETINAQNA